MIYIISGGEFNNKGAEAMTLHAISHIHNADQQAKIVLLTGKTLPSNYHIPNLSLLNTDKHVCDFLMSHSVISLLKAYTNNIIRLFKSLTTKSRIRYTHPVLLYWYFKKAYCFLDIGGYTISSSFAKSRSEVLLKYIEIAHKYLCQIVLMPQSFGPIDFEGSYIDYIKKTLGLCNIIYAREKNGYTLLQKLGLQNVKLHHDMILCDSDESLKKMSFYDDLMHLVPFNARYCDTNSLNVAIIPNCRLTDSTLLNYSQVVDLYTHIIQFLADHSAKVSIIIHSSEDKKLADDIYASYSNSSDLTYLSDVLSSIQFQDVIRNFNFVIASRYHSIIHSFKCNTPAVILGWADKYNELANIFHQSQYVIDLNSPDDNTSIYNSIQRLIDNISIEKKQIETVLSSFQTDFPSCYSFLSISSKSNNISQIKNHNLCVSCGICKAICPHDCISFCNEYPNVNNYICTDCGLCKKVCPGLGYDYSSLNNPYVGNVIAAYSARTLQESIYLLSASGGLVSTMISNLLKNNIYDSAIIPMDHNYQSVVHSRVIKKTDALDISKIAKSRYVPIIHDDSVRYILEHRDEKIIIVGVPCFIHGLLNTISNLKLQRNNYLLIGLFCDSYMTYNIIDFLSNYPGTKKRVVSELFFKDKTNGGWPGNLKIQYTDGTFRYLSRGTRMSLKPYFTSEPCLYCMDKLNVFSDISVGDDYTNKHTKSGRTSIIVRSDLGASALSRVSDSLDISPQSIEDIQLVQKLDKRISHLSNISLKKQTLNSGLDIKHTGLQEDSNIESYKKRYYHLLNQINMGRNRKFMIIYLSISYKKLLNKIKNHFAFR